MASKLGVLALVVAITALGVATYGVSTRTSGPTDVDARLVALEDEVMSLRRAAARSHDEAPSLRGIDPTRLSSAKAAHEEATPVALVSREDGVIDAIVAEAVEKKTQEVVDEMRVKENKKPAMTVLASTLELSPAQVAAAEENVRRAQLDVHALLNTPTEDGSNLMDELVDVVARSIAAPGKDAGWGRLIGRIMSEQVPGTDESYGVRIDAVKSNLRATFKRDWSAEQYKEFEAWGVDPTEIQDVPGSPNAALEGRIGERARDFGAELPEGK